MKWNSIFLSLLTLVSAISALQAQKKPEIKFGKPRPEDFAINGVPFDSGANAIVIADIGSTGFAGNNHGGLNMVFTRFMRVKILNKNGFDIAVTHLSLYHSADAEEKITDLKGSTFNMENGQVTELKLDQTAVFDEKLTKNTKIKKFTLPGLKEGSVFDLTYTINSSFYSSLREWHFQSAYPCLWSEYSVTIPPCFHYVTQSVGSPHYDISESKDVFQSFSIRENNGAESDQQFDISGNSLQHRWVMKDVAAVHDENFLATTDNYSPAVRFQLHYFQQDPTSERHDRMGDWFMASKKLLEDEDFGKALTSDNHWMNAEMKAVIGDASTDDQKLRRIFAYLRSGFNCSSYSGFYAGAPLKDVFRKKSGTAAEINLLLTALLRHEGIDADPVLLSTRENGVAEQSYPLMSQFNYVICNAVIGPKTYHLDASQPLIGFAKLPSYCYNGQARMINAQKPVLINLYPDSVTETTLTSVIIAADEKSFLTGSCMQQLGDAKSYSFREKIRNSSSKEYFKTLQTSMADMADISSGSIDSLDKFDFPVTIRYDMQFKNEGDPDIIYFDPIVTDRYASNPFKAAKRSYPVEMPYCVDEIYTLNLEIPKGYVADEIPKSAKVSLNESEGYFEYLIQKSGNTIQMRVRLKLKKADFEVEDYNTLRDFYAYVVKKESEQIVFKKMK